MMLGVLITFATGLILFLYGYFLTRKELSILSNQRFHGSTGEKRLFLFIIDALRFDFVAPQASKSCGDNSPFNCFSTIQRLLEEQPGNTLIFRFDADPPTVTAQRLKGLTAGCFPTFIDAGSNLNSSAISDDNVLFQLRRNVDGNKDDNLLVALGDDTWASLFPRDVFHTTHMFDSFNTWDLNTVDDGILSQLWKFLPQESRNNVPWRLLIAHFLGVDHIGHTHHALHPLMTQRLRRMDTVLADVLKRLPEDGVLLLFGDHGMTLEGEHGGASDDETQSALFVYSKQPFYSSAKNNKTNVYRVWNESLGAFNYYSDFAKVAHLRAIPQMDLVPTLSYLLNLPIPFSSVGKVIPEIIYDDTSDSTEDEGAAEQKVLCSLRHNTWQVLRFFLTYQSGETLDPKMKAAMEMNEFKDDAEAISALAQIVDALQEQSMARSTLLPAAWLPRLRHLVQQDALHTRCRMTTTCPSTGSFESMDDSPISDNELARQYYQLLTDIQNHARNEWTQFKHPPIILGIGMMALSLLWSLTSVFQPKLWKSMRYIMEWTNVVSQSDGLTVGMGCATLWMGLFFSVLPFSNSFVMEEPAIVFMLWQLLTCLIWMRHCVDHRHRKNIRSNSPHHLLRCFDWLLCGRGLIVLATQRMLWFVSVSLHEQHDIYRVLAPIGLIALGTSALIMRTLVSMDRRNGELWSILAMQCVVAVQRGLAQVPYDTWRIIGQVHLPRAILLVCVSRVMIEVVVSTFARRQSNASAWIWAGTTIYAQYCTSFVNHLVFVVWMCTCYATISRPIATSDHLQRSMVAFWCLIAGRWLFFATQHRCQFNRLQLSVAFIGHPEFSVAYGGWALAVNTMGHDWLLSLLAQHWSPSSSTFASRETLGVRILARRWLILLTCLAAYHLRRHLMLWAIFAPKLVFEVALSGSGLLVDSLLWYSLSSKQYRRV